MGSWVCATILVHIVRTKVRQALMSWYNICVYRYIYIYIYQRLCCITKWSFACRIHVIQELNLGYRLFFLQAMSTFSPVGSLSSNGMRICVYVWTEWTWSMQYVGISTYQFITYYASVIHMHTHSCILKPFEDSELTGLKVDIAFLHTCCYGIPQLNTLGSPSIYYMQLHTDRYTPWGERIACVWLFV